MSLMLLISSDLIFYLCIKRDHFIEKVVKLENIITLITEWEIDQMILEKFGELEPK